MKLRTSICLTTALLLLATTGSTLSAGTEAKPQTVNPTGTWKWTAPPNPDGRIPGTTFTLNLQGRTVTGTVNKTNGSTSITNGVVQGDEVSFQTVLERKGAKSTTTYRGKLSGDIIKGTVEVDFGGQMLSSGWEVKRVKK
jgi:hypothetical protein